MSQLNKADEKQLAERGLSPDKMDLYFSDLKNGFPFVELASNARLGHEIKRFDEDETEEIRNRYIKNNGIEVLKFVPASGAASRMFKDLFSALNLKKQNDGSEQFFKSLEKFAFSEDLHRKAGLEPKKTYTEIEKQKLLESLLLPEGLNYGQLPKGMIKFHQYDSGITRTALEEHFHEAAMYASKNGISSIHFTLPEQIKSELDTYLDGIKTCLAIEFGIDFKISSSVQMPKTDTPAIYVENEDWVRIGSGELLFRPAGHGALLENLNELEADIIFVKNIDNVVPDHSKGETAKHKEVLAGVLLQVQQKIFSFLRDFDQGKLNLEEVHTFFQNELGVNTRDLSVDEIRLLLDRPIRVCGMVQNEGEPGGGPFLVRDGKSVSLQIVEKAQVNLNDPGQKEILESASHFNPVDLVLGVKNYKGQKFDLLKFRNPKTGMRVEKTAEGKSLYALELPGLWNGAMHNWNTIFVEVPISTFNPVKTVLDLARPAHT